MNNENNVFAVGIDNVSHWLHLFGFSPLRIFNFQKWADLKEEENNVLFAAGIDRKPPEQCSHFSVTVSLSPLLHFDILNSVCNNPYFPDILGYFHFHPFLSHHTNAMI